MNFLLELFLWRVLALSFAAECLWKISVSFIDFEFQVAGFIITFLINFKFNVYLLEWLTSQDPSKQIIRYWLPVALVCDPVSVFLGCFISTKQLQLNQR